jgi:hypothetical protein
MKKFKEFLENFDMGEGIKHAYQTYKWGVIDEKWQLPNINFDRFQNFVMQTPDINLSPEQMGNMKWNNTKVVEWAAFKGQGLKQNQQLKNANDPQFIQMVKSLGLEDRSKSGGYSDVESVLYHMNNALKGNAPSVIAVREGEYVTMLDGDHRAVGCILINKPMKIKILNLKNY